MKANKYLLTATVALVLSAIAGHAQGLTLNFANSTNSYLTFGGTFQGGAVEGSHPSPYHDNYAVPVRKGRTIPRLKFYNRALLAGAIASVTRTVASGNWIDVRDRYLGIRFRLNGKTHYGWARMNVKVEGLTITGTLTGYAYETIPNKAIITGKTHGKDEVSLGALAVGSSAIHGWRQK